MSCECCDKSESRSQIHEIDGGQREKWVWVVSAKRTCRCQRQLCCLWIANCVAPLNHGCLCVGVIPKNVFIYACMDSHSPQLKHLNYLISLAFFLWLGFDGWCQCVCMPGTLADPCTRKYSSEIQMHSLSQSAALPPTRLHSQCSFWHLLVSP